MIEAAIEYDRPVRIGVNWGSLDSVLLTQMMDENSKSPEPLDAMEVTRRAIVEARCEAPKTPSATALLTRRSSSAPKSATFRIWWKVYEMLARRCDYALHLGLTEAGLGSKGIVATTRRARRASAAGHWRHDPGVVTPLPNGDRTDEVIVSQQILQALNLRSFTPQVAACPAAAGLRVHSSKTWPTRFKPTCVSRCPCGAKSTWAWKR